MFIAQSYILLAAELQGQKINKQTNRQNHYMQLLSNLIVHLLFIVFFIS